MWQGLVEDGESDSTRFFEPFLYEFRARLALGEERAAYDALSAARGRVEAKFGAGSAASIGILSLMGEEYSRRGHRVIAESLFQEALSLRPSYVPALLGLARVLRDQGSDLEATRRYEEVLRLDPENDQARRELKSLLAKGAR
jgi:tetratricopeptide (TPR) repeat protein